MSDDERETVRCCICLQETDKKDPLSPALVQFCITCAESDDKFMCVTCVHRSLQNAEFSDDNGSPNRQDSSNADWIIENAVDRDEWSNVAFMLATTYRKLTFDPINQRLLDTVKWMTLRAHLFSAAYENQIFCLPSDHDNSLLLLFYILQRFGEPFSAKIISQFQHIQNQYFYQLKNVKRGDRIQPLSRLHLHENHPQSGEGLVSLYYTLADNTVQRLSGTMDSQSLQRQLGDDIFVDDGIFEDEYDEEREENFSNLSSNVTDLQKQVTSILCPLCRSSCNVIGYRQSRAEFNALKSKHCESKQCETEASDGDDGYKHNMRDSQYEILGIFDGNSYKPCKCCEQSARLENEATLVQQHKRFQDRILLLFPILTCGIASMSLTNYLFLTMFFMFFSPILVFGLCEYFLQSNLPENSKHQYFCHAFSRAYQQIHEIWNITSRPGQIYAAEGNTRIYSWSHGNLNENSDLHILSDIVPHSLIFQILSVVLKFLYRSPTQVNQLQCVCSISIVRILQRLFVIKNAFSIEKFYDDFGDLLEANFTRDKCRFRTDKKNCKLDKRLFFLNQKFEKTDQGRLEFVAWQHQSVSRKEELQKQFENEQQTFLERYSDENSFNDEKRLLNERAIELEKLHSTLSITQRIKKTYKRIFQTLTSKHSNIVLLLHNYSTYFECKIQVRGPKTTLKELSQQHSNSSYVGMQRYLFSVLLALLIENWSEANFSQFVLNFFSVVFLVESVVATIKLFFVWFIPALWYWSNHGNSYSHFKRQAYYTQKILSTILEEQQKENLKFNFITAIKCRNFFHKNNQ